MTGWFDLYEWPIRMGAREDRDGKLAAVRRIEETVEMLEEEMGIPPSRVVIGGFSQGGAVALLVAYHKCGRGGGGKVPFAGCICLSGWLTLEDDLTTTDISRTTPLFWGHGERDDTVPFEQQAHGVGRLRELGLDVTDESYPTGHGVHPREMLAVAEFLKRVVPPPPK
jgi:predicted esterase